MRPFLCSSCEVAWVSVELVSYCEYCGRPGFTIYEDFFPKEGLSPSVCDLLYREARKRERISGNA